MGDGGKLKSVLQLDLDPGAGLLDRAVEGLVQGVALGVALLEIGEIAAVAAVFTFAEYCRVDELHVFFLHRCYQNCFARQMSVGMIRTAGRRGCLPDFDRSARQNRLPL